MHIFSSYVELISSEIRKISPWFGLVPWPCFALNLFRMIQLVAKPGYRKFFTFFSKGFWIKWFSTGVDFAFERTFRNGWRHFCHTRNSMFFWYVLNRDQRWCCPHPVHGIVPTTVNYPCQNFVLIHRVKQGNKQKKVLTAFSLLFPWYAPLHAWQRELCMYLPYWA